MDHGSQNIICSLFHAQLKCTYVHVKRKIRFAKLCYRLHNHEIALFTDVQNIYTESGIFVNVLNSMEPY